MNKLLIILGTLTLGCTPAVGALAGQLNSASFPATNNLKLVNKTNLNDMKINPTTIELNSNEVDDIATHVWTTMLNSYPTYEEFWVDLLTNPERFIIKDAEFEMPNFNSSITYNIYIIAKPTDEKYEGVANFKVILKNTGKIDINDFTELLKNGITVKAKTTKIDFGTTNANTYKEEIFNNLDIFLAASSEETGSLFIDNINNIEVIGLDNPVTKINNFTFKYHIRLNVVKESVNLVQNSFLSFDLTLGVLYKNLIFNPNYSESGSATADLSSYGSWANSDKYRSWNTIADLSKWYAEDWDRFKTEYFHLIINYSNLGYDWNWSLIVGSHSNEDVVLNLKDISPTEEGTMISELLWSDYSGMAYADITLKIWVRIVPETMELQFRTYGFMEIKVISAPLDRISGTMAINSVKFE